ncbi:hypothetical protein OC845_001668 [Tilletia horrida]|nr:hypothetical protein OC845_001668 [Tilletia horrida]
MSAPRSSIAPIPARREAASNSRFSTGPLDRHPHHHTNDHIRSSRSSSEVASKTPSRPRTSKYSAPPSSFQPKTPLKPVETPVSATAQRTSRVSEQGRTPRARPSSSRPSIPASGSTPSTARASLAPAADRVPKSRSHTSSLGSALSQRGILTSTTAANYTKEPTSSPAVSAHCSSSSLVSSKSSSAQFLTTKAALPKARPHSLRETPTRPPPTVASASLVSRSRSNSTASDLTVKDKMFGSAPRNIDLQRRMRQDSVATVYTQNSAEDEDDVGSIRSEEDDQVYDARRPHSGTPSLSTTVSSNTTDSERNSVGPTRKAGPVEYTNPFGGAMPIQPASAVPHKMHPFGLEGIRKESVANWAADRLGSIGGDVEFKGMSARFQEIEGLLASGRASRARRPSEAMGAGLNRSPTKSRSGSITQAQKPAAVARRPSISANPGPVPSMAPPPRPPRSGGRARALSKPPELASVGEVEAGESPKKRETQSVILSEAVNLAQHSLAVRDAVEPSHLRPVSVDTGARRMSESKEENAGGDGKPTPGALMTREQWEAEYLPRLIEKERKRLIEEQASDSSKANSLKSPKSTPSLSRSPDRPSASPTKEATADPATGFMQGKEARKRSQSPIKSHRSSPALFKPDLEAEGSPAPVRKEIEQPASPTKDVPDAPSSPKRREGSPFKAALAAAQANRATRMRSDSIRIGPFDTVPATQPSIARDNVAMAPPSRSRSTSPNKLTRESPKLAPPADILSQDRVNVVDTTSERHPTFVHRGSISSEAGQVGQSGTAQSTPTLDLKMNDPLTNLAIADVSTDLMGDYEHSLMALYKSSDVSFDQGGQNLYKLLGGDGPSSMGVRFTPTKNRPRSELFKDAAKKGENGHVRQHSDQTNSQARKQDASTMPSDKTVTPSSNGPRHLQMNDEITPSRVGLGGSPAKARAPNGPQQLSSTPIGLGISMVSPFSSRTPIGGSPLKARLDSGASPDQAALPPLALNSKRGAGKLAVPGKASSPTKASSPANNVGDDTTMLMGASTIRNLDGSFLMDEKVDDSMLFGPDIGTFSGKKVEQIRNRLKATRAAGVAAAAAAAPAPSSKGVQALMDMYTPPSSGSDGSDKGARFTSQKSGSSSPVKPVPMKQNSTPATSTGKDYGLGMRQPSTRNVSGSAPRPSVGSRIPSLTVQPPTRTSSIQRTTSFDNTQSGSRPENNGARRSLPRSCSADQRPQQQWQKASDWEPVPPLNIRKTSGMGPPANDSAHSSLRSSVGPGTNPSSPARPTEAQVKASARARIEAGIKSRASMAAMSADHRRNMSNASSEGFGDGLPKSMSLGDLSGISVPSPQGTPASSRYGALSSGPTETLGGAGRPMAISRPSLPSTVSRLPTRGRHSGSIPRAPGVPF